MSKVVIKSNVLGFGTFTIAAPNSNTLRMLTYSAETVNELKALLSKEWSWIK